MPEVAHHALDNSRGAGPERAGGHLGLDLRRELVDGVQVDARRVGRVEQTLGQLG